MMTALLLALFMMNVSKAQDVVKTNPKNCKLLCDTAGVRMVLVTIKPGEELTLHTHPINEMYCLTSGQVTVTHKGGTKDVLNVKAGQAMQGAPEIPHTTKNTGTTTVKLILVEIEK